MVSYTGKEEIVLKMILMWSPCTVFDAKPTQEYTLVNFLKNFKLGHLAALVCPELVLDDAYQFILSSISIS